jgi:hypothetical protein
MATWASLTSEQQAVYQTWERQLRAAMGQFFRLAQNMEAIDAVYNGQITGMSLDGAELVPNSSGLPGSESITGAEAVTLESYLQGMLSTYFTTAHQQNMAQAAGLQELVG